VSRHKRAPGTLAANLPRLIEVLTRNGHRHALIGGVAVGVWVEPRATKDIDFVISARVEDVDRLLKAAEAAGFAVHFDEVERLKRSFMTRVWTVDSTDEPVMIDLLLDEHPFYDVILDRSVVQRLGDTELRVGSPEDILLLKVLASRPQDVADVARLVQAYGPSMDVAHLRKHAHELGIESEVERALGNAGPGVGS
jgi:hypothetical protein